MDTNTPEICRHCGHQLNPHVMVLVIDEPVPAGYMKCAEEGCDCFSTWGATTRRSTPEEAHALREAVLRELRRHGIVN